jgi:hypothetical protein
VAAWKLTVRHGSDVSHESYDDLGEAVSAMRRRALEIRAEGPAKPVAALRDFMPSDQVNARLELRAKGFRRKATAGIDVRGNGELVPYQGGLRREELDPSRHDTPFDVVRETLEGDG